jgi:DNA-directed RNA polymerase specialized sigma24 family protein
MPSENFEVIGNDIRMLSREEILMRVYDASIKEINRLPDNLKLIMTEKLIKNKKLEEVAAEQNIPVSSVKNWLRSGRLKIREKFKTDYKDLYELYLDVAGETGYLL